jgi:hypothetical protein
MHVRGIAVISYAIALMTALVLGSVLLSARTQEELVAAGEADPGVMGLMLR